MQNDNIRVMAGILAAGLWAFAIYLNFACDVSIANEAIPFEARLLIGVLYILLFLHSWMFRRKRDD